MTPSLDTVLRGLLDAEPTDDLLELVRASVRRELLDEHRAELRELAAAWRDAWEEEEDGFGPPAFCEACYRPSTHDDSHGVRLCTPCWEAL